MSIKSYKIKDNFYLNEMEVVTPTQNVKVPSPQNQFIIIDRSGSMWRELDNVCDSIMKYVNGLAEGSTVSVGYFSSSGEYGLSVPYTLKKEEGAVKKVVDSYRKDLGCTCFNEVLAKINEQFKDDEKGSLFFFTDGCHNSGPWSKVIEELKKMKPHLEIAMFVGCGYIDRDNMTEMADTVEGSFIHLSEFNEFEETLKDFGDGIQDSVPGCIVNVTSEQENICSVVGKQVIAYKPNDGKFKYKASTKKTQVYYCTSEKPLGKESDAAGKNEIPFRTMAYYLVQHNKTPLAIDILNYIGDKYLINALWNCFTNDEYSKVEQKIRSSIFYSKNRYKEGQVKNYVPKDDAFCVLDALDALTSDKDAVIDLTDKEFVYNKISRATTQEDGSKMIYPNEITASANKLVYNEDALNVSMQCVYNADVPLNSDDFKKTEANKFDYKKFGLTKESKQSVTCYRNYSIIADAKLNTPKLVVKGINKKTVQRLSEIIKLRDDQKYVLDLSNIPLINKEYLKETSAAKLAENCWTSKLIGTELSVLRYLINEINQENGIKPVSQNSELRDALESYFYIRNGIYNPPTKVVASTDFYMHYEFRITFKGYSAVTASSVIKKIKDGKSLTDRELFVAEAYNKFKDKNLNELQMLYDDKLVSYRNLNNEIQHAKFAIILINRGSMPEFESRDNMAIDITTNINGISKTITTKFEIVQKPVKI